jgi:hypothetical protein
MNYQNHHHWEGGDASIVRMLVVNAPNANATNELYSALDSLPGLLLGSPMNREIFSQNRTDEQFGHHGRQPFSTNEGRTGAMLIVGRETNVRRTGNEAESQDGEHDQSLGWGDSDRETRRCQGWPVQQISRRLEPQKRQTIRSSLRNLCRRVYRPGPTVKTSSFEDAGNLPQ